MNDFNDLVIRGSDGYGDKLRTPSIKSGNVTAHFANLENALIWYIGLSDAVVGCVAWLTNYRILDALSDKPVSILVQKEDFLREDSDSSRFDVRKKYEALERYRGGVDPSSFLTSETDDWISRIEALSIYGHGTERERIVALEQGGYGYCEAVRCVGNRRQGRAQAERLMHHKFLVFLKRSFVSYTDPTDNSMQTREELTSYAIWTGSLNMTHNGVNSFENGVYIEDTAIAYEYLREFAYLYMFSDPLNWESPEIIQSVEIYDGS